MERKNRTRNKHSFHYVSKSFPLTLYGYLQSGNSFLNCVFSYIKYFFFVGKLYNSYHLWYLLALIYAVILIRFMLMKQLNVKLIVIAAILLYSVNEFMLYAMEHMQNSENLIYKCAMGYQFVFNKGGIFTGMIYVVAGMMIAILGKYMNRWFAVFALIAINLCKVFCSTVIVDYLKVLEAIFVFMIILSIEIGNSHKYMLLRKASTVIYLSHLLWYSLYSFIIIKEPNKLGMDSFVITSVLAALFAFLSLKLVKSNLNCIFC